MFHSQGTLADLPAMLASGMQALDSGELTRAEDLFRQVLAHNPRRHEAWHGLAWAYLQSGQGELALEHARRAHELNRQSLDYLNTLGVAYGETGQLAQAEATFRKALKRDALFLNALINLAKTLEKQERIVEARKAYERALALEPAYPKLVSNLAKIMRQCGAAAEARALLERHAKHVAAEDLAMALAECELELEHPQAARQRLSVAVREHPEWMAARNAFAHLLLSLGQWMEGWQHYLWRRVLLDPSLPAPPQTPLPSSLDGEEVMIRGEQGIGDVLFFLRFVPSLRERGAAVALACEKKLHPLLRPGPALEAVRDATQETSHPFAHRLWLGDLPALLESRATPPAWPLTVERESADAAREQLAALGPAPYVGVTWRAGTDAARGREFGIERSSLTKAVPPRALAGALRGWPGTVVLLQRGARPGEVEEFAAAFGARFHDLSHLGEELKRLLAVLAELHEYVTVSNTNVHLLAGLGKTARVLVPFPAEWRWMRRDGASPWFPDFAVYRQASSRSWSAALESLRRDLQPGK